MQFDAPWLWLVLLPLSAYLAWLAGKSYAQLVPAARWGSLALRLLMLVALVGAMTRPTYLSRLNHHHLIFAVDVSKSVSTDNMAAALDDIDRLASNAAIAHGDARISVIAFGRQPAMLLRSQAGWSGWTEPLRDRLTHEASLASLYAERTRLMTQAAQDGADRLKTVQERIASLEGFRGQVVGDFTDLEAAVRLALNCGEAAERKTIYVVSDGNFNCGSQRDVAPDSLGGSVRIHAVALNRPMPAEAAVVDVILPPSVRVNQGFTAEIVVAATIEMPARLVVFKDGFQLQEIDVALKPGENRVKAGGLFFRDKGFHTVQATIRAANDTRLENNSARSLVVVPGEARVLYVDSDETQMPYLKSALELEGMSVDARPAGGVPASMSDLLSYDVLILSNVPADRLTYRQMQLIRTYVQEFGGGFIMLGGTESFGLGGFYNTPIEEVLPVRMPIQKEMNRPSLAILLVIDKSGSMSGVKIELAKRAAVATSEAINPRDLIGLIGFDGEARVLMELTPAADRQTIASQIAQLDAGGGTFLYPALEDAHNRLAQSNAKRKHVIVLSDGQTQGFGYEDKVGAMAADGITLSAIGIGEGADMRLMEAIAMAGGGRAYFTDDFYSIPQIFTREALRASNSMLVERLVQPVAVGDDVCLDEIDADELPLLSGYVATTMKPAGDLIIASDSGDPLLAKWRYGMGRTAAFTSETKPRWAEDWIQWHDFAKFWSQLVRSVAGEELSKSYAIECHHVRQDGAVRLTADVRTPSGEFVTEGRLGLTMIDSGGRPRDVPVTRVGPGLFEARLETFEFGRDQQCTWRLDRPDAASNGSASPATPYGFVYSFSPEFQALSPNVNVLDEMAARGGGEMMPVGQAKLALAEVPAVSRHALWPPLLIVALLLAPLDILVRRLG